MKSSVQYCIEKIDKRYPFTFIDIGAMGGIPKKWDLLGNAKKVLAFEPDQREFSKLKNTGQITYLNYLIHSKSQELLFYIARGGGKSSIYQPNISTLSQFADIERFDIVEENTLPAERIRSLDSIIEEYSILDADFIKLDTEGSELPILEGSRRKALPKIFGIQIEVEFIEKCEHQPLFRHVDQFLAEAGFQLMDLRRQYWKRKDFYDFQGKGQLVFGDAFYFKKIDVLAKELSFINDVSYCSSKIYKCVLSCMVYKSFDYAVSLSKMGCAENYLSPADCEELILAIKKYAKKGTFPNFWGRGKIYKILNRICEKLKPRSYLGWSDSDRMIGNIKDI